MINCPNCQKRIVTILGKEHVILCPCKYKIFVSDGNIARWSFYVPWKDKRLELVFVCTPEPHFVIYEDNLKEILRLNCHPDINPNNAPQKLKTYFIFS